MSLIVVSVAVAVVGAGAAPAASGFRTIKDPSGKPLVSVPQTWHSNLFRTKDGLELFVVASPDPQSWDKVWAASYEKPGPKQLNVDWTIPGIIVIFSKKIATQIKTAGVDYVVAFDRLARWHGANDGHAACLRRLGVSVVDKNGYSGFESLYRKCGGKDARLYDVGAMPAAGTPVVHAIATAVTPSDDAIVRRILTTIR